MPRSRWRWDKERQELYEVQENDAPPMPRVFFVSSFDAYRSPVTGETIRGSRQRSQDLSQHGCVDARDVPSREQQAALRERRHEQSIKEAVNDAARELCR